MPTRAAGGSCAFGRIGDHAETANGSLCRAASRRQCALSISAATRLRLAMKRQLLRGGHQGPIDAGDRSTLHRSRAATSSSPVAGPIDGVALARHLPRRPRCRRRLSQRETWRQAAGDTEADDGLAAARRFAPGSGRLAEARPPPPETALTPADRAAMRASARRPVTAMTKPRCRLPSLTSRPGLTRCWRISDCGSGPAPKAGRISRSRDSGDKRRAGSRWP